MNGIFGLSSWSVVIGLFDVLLVSFLIYRILLLVRGTRAQPMLIGLFIIALFYVASRYLGLVTFNWIIGNFLGSVILVIVVLFQDDFRRALTKVGLMPGFGADSGKAGAAAINEIAKAAAELSERRVGALIVIARDVGLHDYSEQAVQIDAKVSHQLLESIFHPGSPIHDGAVIVDKGRVVAAGAFLPLTFNPSVSKTYGTRHRAAIGLSERTDALIVVVSEETGAISLVRETRITRDLTEKSLANALHRLTFIRQSRRNLLSKRLGTLGKKTKTQDTDSSSVSKDPEQPSGQ